MKVSNLLSVNAWAAWREGILTSIISEQMETESFLNAYIFLPIKGLKNRHSVISLDFASLYPSLIMTYNLLPDKIILSQKHADSLKKSGKKLYEINFKFNDHDILTWSIEHNNIPEEKNKKEDMELVIGLIGKGLLLLEVIKQEVKIIKRGSLIGIVQSLPINIKHMIIRTPVQVLESKDKVLLLGNDWLQKVHANIDWKKEQLSIFHKGRTVTIPVAFTKNIVKQPSESEEEEEEEYIDEYEEELLLESEGYYLSSKINYLKEHEDEDNPALFLAQAESRSDEWNTSKDLHLGQTDIGRTNKSIEKLFRSLKLETNGEDLQELTSIIIKLSPSFMNNAITLKDQVKELFKQLKRVFARNN
ncbi:hypothetical protein C1645_826452 [Glomus cerebriforme]|uniref:DNA-directed DNA polymerase n=1 Tax=Glomus cerebriforme TaxID=658196 RepID=A0A397SUW0_9GLOM|nr:hypothetical protein C1645_826452 [Glomus cerebriforme]